MIPLDSKSYPYLAIAQHYNVDYGEVLKFVDKIGKEDIIYSVDHAWQMKCINKWKEINVR